MTIYLLDLSTGSKGHDYGPLWKAMDTVEAKRALDTTWFLESNHTVQELTTELATLLHPNDKFLIMEVAPNAAWAAVRLEHETGLWLREHRP